MNFGDSSARQRLEATDIGTTETRVKNDELLLCRRLVQDLRYDRKRDQCIGISSGERVLGIEEEFI